MAKNFITSKKSTKHVNNNTIIKIDYRTQQRHEHENIFTK